MKIDAKLGCVLLTSKKQAFEKTLDWSLGRWICKISNLNHSDKAEFPYETTSSQVAILWLAVTDEI